LSWVLKDDEFKLAERKKTVLLDEGLTETKAHVRDKERVKGPGICAGLRVRRPGLRLLLIM